MEVEKLCIRVLFCILLVLLAFNVYCQTDKCSVISNNLMLFNDSALKVVFKKNEACKIIMLGELHGKRNSEIYSKVLTKGIKYDGYNVVITEQPVSYTLLYEELLDNPEYNKIASDLILKYLPNKKNFAKTLFALYQLNKIKPIKVICPDIEHSLSDAADRIHDILSIHKNTLSGNFLNLYETISKAKRKTIIYEGDCAILFREILSKNENGDFNDSACLKQHFAIFKNILKAVSINGLVTMKGYTTDERESLIAYIITEQFKQDTTSKAIGFFGSAHVQFVGDTMQELFIREPLAKKLNSAGLLKDKVQSVLLQYKSDKEYYDYYQRYLFGDYVSCFTSMNVSNEYLFIINNEMKFTEKTANYSFIIYL